MMVMTGLQKTEAIGRLAMKTAQAICKSLPLDSYDNIIKMSEKILKIGMKKSRYFNRFKYYRTFEVGICRAPSKCHVYKRQLLSPAYVKSASVKSTLVSFASITNAIASCSKKLIFIFS